MLSTSNAPITINASMTEMAVIPNHDIGPLSSSLDSRYNSLSSPASRTPQSPWCPKSPISPTSIPSKSFPSELGSKSCSKSCVSPTSLSPTSVTPRSVRFVSPKKQSPYSPQKAMKKRGYAPLKSLGSTLQGCVWKVKKSEQTSIVKVTKKALHNKSVALINGKEIEIEEDIIKETAILRYLSSANPPKSLAKFEHFFSDKTNYFLVQENGGSGLFEFVAKCHKFIENGQLSIVEWHRFCKVAFKQMVKLLHWMHTKMNTVHLDISLENFVIDNVMVSIKPNTKQIVFSHDFQIKIIDFGLAEVFTSFNEFGEVDFQCNKFVGKTAYKAPKVYGKKKVFDARSADCWSLGVVLFTMVIGGSPYKKPSKNDVSFDYIFSGKIIELLSQWNRIDFVTPKLIDLMYRIFRREEERLNIDEISKHPWLL